ncbi:hypothetical protein FQR65_LT14702 [Abscondita terminalis]|nr:hypothetical protein FQR65_LT14702 [Abscondita terminalis]
MEGLSSTLVENGNVNTTMELDYQKEDKGNATNKSPISLRTLPQTEKTKIIDKPSEQLSESRIMPITKIQSNKNFKPMLHLLASETDNDEK